MGRPRSPNPGKVVGLYLKGEHLATLRCIHEKPAHAIRILIEQAAVPRAEPELPKPPEQRPGPPPLCETCQRDGYPDCRDCIHRCLG
jgi:hypothetical protein